MYKITETIKLHQNEWLFAGTIVEVVALSGDKSTAIVRVLSVPSGKLGMSVAEGGSIFVETMYLQDVSVQVDLMNILSEIRQVDKEVQRLLALRKSLELEYKLTKHKVIQ